MSRPSVVTLTSVRASGSAARCCHACCSSGSCPEAQPARASVDIIVVSRTFIMRLDAIVRGAAQGRPRALNGGEREETRTAAAGLLVAVTLDELDVPRIGVWRVE